MRYQRIVKGVFAERPNRFIAHVDIDGRREVVHVKNTGRCRELLIPGATVYLEKSNAPGRKTDYDLIAVKKGERLINMDSQAPNKVVEEWLLRKELFPDLVMLRPETKYGNSRFDFYAETENQKIFIEVKGVTLEQDGTAMFPDAPSDRAVKHVEELIQAKGNGFEAYIILVIQMRDVKCFLPNHKTHPEFAVCLEKAAAAGVKILAYDCRVELTESGGCADTGYNSLELQIQDPVQVYLSLENLKASLRKKRLLLISKPLLTWYDEYRRILPWREDPTPYHVWVSEIMLQQTRVEAVKPYYKRFMETLPEIRSLAMVDEQRLLKLWEGLGYYSRARNLQKAAIQILEKYQGVMPKTYEELLKLKGIGSYTAGAIASIAYGEKVPAVDGNVLRVISRICMEEGQITDSKVKLRIEAELRETMSKERPGDFNQAMMELGAMVCVPNGAPHCDKCPLKELCQAYEHHCQEDFPKKAGKKARSIEEKTVLIIQDGAKTAIRQRPDKGLLAGLYEFPILAGYKNAEEVVSYLTESGLTPLRIQPLRDSKHIFTHKEWHMKGYQIRVDELQPQVPCGETKEWIFIEPWQAQEAYPIPSAFAAYVPYLNMKLGKDSLREIEERN